jgi:hypothetical protein
MTVLLDRLDLAAACIALSVVGPLTLDGRSGRAVDGGTSGPPCAAVIARRTIQY